MSAPTFGIPCAFHSQEIITNFCRSDRCLLPLCPKCIRLHVDQHIAVDSFAEIQSIDLSLKQAVQSMESMQRMFNKLGEELSDIQSQKERIKGVIRSRLHEAKIRMIKQVQRGIDKIQKHVITQITDFEEKIALQLLDIDKSIRQLITKVWKNIDQLASQRCLKTLIVLNSDTFNLDFRNQFDILQQRVTEIKDRKFDLSINEQMVFNVKKDLKKYINVATNDRYLKDSMYVLNLDRETIRRATLRLSKD